MIKYLIFIFFVFIALCDLSVFVAQAGLEELELLDSGDEVLLENLEKKKLDSLTGELNLSDLEEIDDLNALRQDIGAMVVEKKKRAKKKKRRKKKKSKKQLALEEKKRLEDERLKNIKLDDLGEDLVFDVGLEEKKLLEISKYVEGKISPDEWNEIAAIAKLEKYIIQKGDWLWKISQKLFGSGFYYSKIWSLNPHITNPHEIEPGMTLMFDTGDIDSLPTVKLGEFAELENEDKDSKDKNFMLDFKYFGDNVAPPWLKERQRLKDQGVYFQYASDASYDDLVKLTGKLSKEYRNYTPPESKFFVTSQRNKYDESGFDKNSKIVFNYKEGFYLNTFVTTNPVIDYGAIDSMGQYKSFIGRLDRFFVKFDPSVKVKGGDLYSVYKTGGEVSHEVSDRKGFSYTIIGQFKTIIKKNHLWECELISNTGIIMRGDRITVYTPKITRIIKTFNARRIEAAFIGAHGKSENALSYGDVVYLDRGRSDGVELGNVFNIYSFYDHGASRKITPDPAYKIGELTIITLTDNFSTAIITNSSYAMQLGTLAITKSPEEAAEVMRKKAKSNVKNISQSNKDLLEELDVELNIDDISDDLLNRADQIKLTEDELQELERQEQEKSVIKDHEKDLQELEKLEQDIMDVENKMKDIRIDEDKFLEGQDLNQVEKSKIDEEDRFGALDDVERKQGRKYMEEDLNSMENPYGLTEFDLEEIDELLNNDLEDEE